VQTKTFSEKAYSTGISEFGLLGNYKQFNVALTRAESYLVVIGDPNSLSKDPYWRQFLLFCLRNSCWYGIKSPISNLVHLDGLIRLQKCPQDQEMYEQSVSPPLLDGVISVVYKSSLEKYWLDFEDEVVSDTLS
jgi:hypothetical protein